MDILLEPLQRSEIDVFTTIYWEAFNPLGANMILPSVYPRGLQPDLKERLRNRVLKILQEKPTDTYFCAKNSSTGEVLGVSWWSIVDPPPQTLQERDESYQKAKKARSGGVKVEGMNQALEDAYFRASYYSEAETMGSEPYVTLKMLAIRPQYARKGVGTVLLRDGLKKVDQLGLPAFIHSGVQAKPLYERHGFKVVGDMPVNALDYGGRSDGHHWCMIRPPKSRITTVDQDG